MIIKYNLNINNTYLIVDIFPDVRKIYLTTSDSVFDGATLKIGYRLDESDYFTDIDKPGVPGEAQIFTNFGAGYELQGLAQTGQLKFYIENATNNTSINLRVV